MSIILDLIVIAIIAVMVLISAKRGFVFTALEVVGFIAATLIAAALTVPASNFTYQKVVDPTITTYVEGITENTTADIAENVWESLPDIIKENAATFGVDKETFIESIPQDTSLNTKEVITEFTQKKIKPIIMNFIESFVSVILLIALLFVVKIIVNIVNKFIKLIIPSKINTILGGVLGAVKGGIIAGAFCAIVCLVLAFVKDGIWIFTTENIEKTFIFKFLADLIKF